MGRTWGGRRSAARWGRPRAPRPPRLPPTPPPWSTPAPTSSRPVCPSHLFAGGGRPKPKLKLKPSLRLKPMPKLTTELLSPLLPWLPLLSTPLLSPPTSLSSPPATRCNSVPEKTCERIPTSTPRKVARTVCDTVVDVTTIEDCTETVTKHCQHTSSSTSSSSQVVGSHSKVVTNALHAVAHPAVPTNVIG